MSTVRLFTAAWFVFAFAGALNPGRPVIQPVQPIVRRAGKRASIAVSAKASVREASFHSMASANPSGCQVPSTKAMQHHWDSMTERGGTYPADEFKHLLSTRKGVVAYVKNATWDTALSKELNLPWCPEPRNDNLPELQNASAEEYLKLMLQDVDTKKPVVISSIEIFGQNDYHLFQVSNFFCGLKRLGLESQVAIFALTKLSAETLRQMHPWLRVLWHPALEQMLVSMGKRTHIRGNRLAKLVFAELILRMDREVLVSDLDTYWFQDPSTYFQQLKMPSGDVADVVAMADSCWLELNSGYVYYRPTARAHALLHTAMSTQRFDQDHPRSPGTRIRLVSDNDQYLLNCGLARTAIGGLNYIILPRTTFHFGPWADTCVNGSGEPAKSSVPPLVWHTGGFQSSYEDHIDRFAVLGLIDVDAKSGKCTAGLRGSKQDAERAGSAMARLCDLSPGGYMTTGCNQQCPPGRKPVHAQALLAQQEARAELGPMLADFARRRRRRRTPPGVKPEPETELALA